MMLSSKAVFGIAAGVCGTIFLGYCIYFDRQRHNDPNFKKKLHERRRAKRSAQASAQHKTGPGSLNMKDHQAVQNFFLQEIQLGEELLASGDIDNGVEHLGNAIAVCGQPNQLLQVLQQTLPPQVFHLLLQRLPMLTARVQRNEPLLQDEDVE